jgi:succinoglycan biosynthesis transport protein ExoP
MANAMNGRLNGGRPGYTARDFFHSVFKRFHIFVGVPIIIIALIVVISMIWPPVFEATTDLKIDDTNYDNIGLSDERYRSADNMILRKEQQINSEIKVARSSTVLRKVVDDLGLWKQATPADQPEETRRAEALGDLDANLTVEPSRDSWVITIKYRCGDPEQAAQVANKVAEHYIEHNIDVNKLPRAGEFYQERIEIERAELDKLHMQFRQLKEDEKVVAYEAEVNQRVIDLGNWESRLTEVRKEILSRQAKINKINDFLRDNPDIIIPIPEIASIRIIEDLNYRLVNQRLELSALQEKYTDKHRDVIEIKQQIEETKKELRGEVHNIIERELTELRKLEAERDALVSSIARIKQEMIDLQGVEAPYTNLEQQITGKQEIIRDLNRKYKDSLYAGQTDVRLGRVKQISRASAPVAPVFPNLRLNLLIGIPLAILFGLALVIFLDALDRTFANPERVERVLGLPVLASVNQFDPRRQRVFR